MSRTHIPRSRRIWRFLRNLLKSVSIASLSILSVLIAACLVGDVAALLNGKTVSTDAGVPPWPERVGLGLVIWLFTFPLTAYGFLYLIKRRVSRTSTLPYWVGGILILPCFFFFGLFATFAGWENIPFCLSLVRLFTEHVTKH